MIGWLLFFLIEAAALLALDRVCWTRISLHGRSRCVTRSHYRRRCQEWRDDAAAEGA